MAKAPKKLAEEVSEKVEAAPEVALEVQAPVIEKAEVTYLKQAAEELEQVLKLIKGNLQVKVACDLVASALSKVKKSI